ncbi:MAG TPA: glycerophosphodiester phosphodiesterase family protein [Candidatus Ozemobacteraceae bacterium]|nr:glycerophosphodiester phosphodiesterase family protein [Candidatus Ozemobacteraceae bacterium]
MRTMMVCLLTLLFVPAVIVAFPLNIAHRGARSVAPENTMAAFQVAVERFGADMVELDVHLSKDGVPIVIHDDDLVRTTNAEEVYPDRAPWLVADFTAAELLMLDAGSWFVEKDPFGQIKAGAVPAADVAEYKSGRIRLPTLRTVLIWAARKGVRLNVEIKDFPVFYPGIVEKIVTEIRRAKLEQNVIISSFNHQALVDMQKVAPEIETGALNEDPVYPLKPYLVDLLQVKAYHPSFEVLGEKSVDYRRHGRMRTDIVQEAQQAGLKVNVWTVNDPAKMKSLIEAGVDGIITDFPQTLRTLGGGK